MIYLKYIYICIHLFLSEKKNYNPNKAAQNCPQKHSKHKSCNIKL